MGSEWYVMHADGTYDLRTDGYDRTDEGVSHQIELDNNVLDPENEPFCVSTVFLGLDHSFGDVPPLLFETMVFKSDGIDITNYMDLYCDRYTTIDEARAGHLKAVAKVGDGTFKEWDDNDE